MYTMIFAAAFAIVAVLFIVFGLLKGRKYVWIYSAMKIGAVVLSAVVSVLISTVLFRYVIELVLGKLMESGKLGDVGAILEEMPSAPVLISALISMIIAPFLFWVFFYLFKKIFYFIAKLISRKLIKIPALAPVHKDEEKFQSMSKRKQKKLALRTYASNPIGMLLGGILGLLLFFVAMVPILGTVGIANDVVTTVAVMSDNETLDKVSEIVDAADENFTSRAIGTLGADAVYDQLTTYDVGAGKARFSDEVNFVMVTGKAAYAMSDKQVTNAEAAAAVKEVGTAFSESMLIPTAASDLLSAAGDDWAQGRDFHGIKKPSFSQSLDGIVEPLLDILAESDAVTIRADVKTIANVVASVIEHDAASKLTTNVMAVFEDTELSYEIIYEILENERLAPMVGEIAEVGLDMLAQKLDTEFEGIDIDSSNIQDKEAEAHEFADVLYQVAGLLEKINSDGMDAYSLAKDVGPMLDELDHTESIGHSNTSAILKGVFLSEQLYSQVGMTETEARDIADSINEKSVVKGYTPLITAVMDTVDVIHMSTDKNASSAEMVAKMEVLLQDLTPESAELLSEMTSANVIESKGVPTQTAEPMADMLSNMFTELSTAKENGMPDEQYNKEAKAMTNMMNIAMNFDKADSDSMFGEGSATGVEADEFVNNMFDSTVITSTVVDTVYGDGDEPTNDPLNFGKTLNEADKDKAVTALNDKWSSATEEEKADAEYQKTYVAIGSVMNIEITVTSEGIVG